jgi:hypothetical protein
MTKSVLTLSIAAMLTIPFGARADLITGVLNFTGTAQISTSVATPGSIVFLDNAFNVDPGVGSQTGGFVAFEGTDGTIANITNPPDATDVALDQPFMTFAIAPNITIALTFLKSGIDGVAGCEVATAVAGQVCTPAPPITPDVSPFNLQNTSATSSSASFDMLGVEHDSLTNTNIGVVGSFTDPATAMSYQALLTLIEGGGTFTTAFAGQIVTVPTPEPGTLTELMMGFCLVGIGLVYRRNKLKRA